MDKYTKPQIPNCDQCGKELEYISTSTEMSSLYREELSPDEVLVELYYCKDCNLEFNLHEDGYLEDA